MATLAIRIIAIKRKTTKLVLPSCYRNGDSAGESFKSGVTLGINHIYLLSLFELFALHFGSLFGLVLILYPDLGHLLGK